MHGHRHGYARRRPFRSLRGRLARAFVMVSVLTLVAAFVAIGTGPYGRVGHHPWRMQVIIPALVVAAGTGVFTAMRIIRPLSRLQQAVERLDLRDLSLRVPVEGDDEVVALARSFNRMVDRLEAEERVRRQLFADVAHELRHPLAVLKGRLDMMQDGVVALDQEQVLVLQDMSIAINRLVDDLRDLSLADVGRLSLHPAPVDLGELIEDMQENLEPVASDKQIELVADVAPDLPRITADAGRLQQVLINLVTNALRHTPESGRVTVRAWSDGQNLIIQVADTGPGIDPEILPHIFDRFYRADKTRTRATGGSGLGLAIVRSLVTLHGGTVQAESTPGEGSCFTVTLPLQNQ